MRDQFLAILNGVREGIVAADQEAGGAQPVLFELGTPPSGSDVQISYDFTKIEKVLDCLIVEWATIAASRLAAANYSSN